MAEMSNGPRERSPEAEECLDLLKARGLIRTVEWWSDSMIMELIGDIDREKKCSFQG